MKNQLLDRINHCIKELEENLESLIEQYKKLGPGTMAFDVTLKIERVTGELNSYKEIRDYIKFDL